MAKKPPFDLRHEGFGDDAEGSHCVPHQDRLLNTGLLEAARASWWHSIFLKGAGVKIGRGVYFDTLSFSVSLL